MSQPTFSPVTGIIDEENVVIDFGEYEGRSVKEIQEIDPDFYDSLILDKGEGRYAIKREAYLDGNKTFRLYLNPLAQLDQ